MDSATLSQYLEQTMNPEPTIRRQAEQYLNTVEATPNYPLMLLMIVDNEGLALTVRLAASIAFKNFIKNNWGNDEEPVGDGSNTIPENNKISMNDRDAIKTTIVGLMLKSPPAIQKQFSDAVSIIGKFDFPKRWPQLMDMLIEKFAHGNFHEINGILRTAHSLFKRYRFEFKSQTLWEEIKYVLDKLAKPLTDLFTSTLGIRAQHSANPDALKTIYDSLALVCKVFYSLNYQDLPEFFEDNMGTWMPAFYDLLTVDVACLKTPSDSDEAGVLEQLRSQICENLCLYAQKYDEEFGPFMPKFVTAVWELLVNTGIETKYDTLVSHALNFLGTVADRNHYRHLFEDPNVLESICSKVIIPNMKFRESDEELFEDNPEEYIRRDMEGSDIDTRRRSACDLVKTLSTKFEQKIFEIFSQYLSVLLANNAQNQKLSWRDKDTAIFLVTSLASKGSTQKHGVTQTSELVPLPQFFQEQIVPELMRQDVNELPVLKADALKFVVAFRNILGGPNLLQCLPVIMRHLQAGSVVVHTYAATAIEKLFIMRTSPENKPVFTQADLAPLSGDLLGGLFATLNLPGSAENEYVMKAIMRSFSALQESSMPYMAVALPRLTEILTQVSKNPSKPHFNHYLFETLCLVTKIVCKVQPDAVSSFEEALFPIFQQILQQDILEFIPYVFQLLSLLLEIRETNNAPVPEPYWALFPCLLSPTLWDRPGNVTPLIRLVCAFIRRGAQQIASYDKLNPILGVFQKMIASKANDHEGFNLLQTLLEYYPMEQLQGNVKQIFTLLFQRLSLAKTTKYIRGIIVFFGYYAAKVGGAALVDIVDQIQAQMFGMVLERVLIPDMNRVTTEADKKIVTIGVSKLLCETPAMLNAPYVNFWPRLLETLIQVFELPPDTSTLDGDHFIEVDDAVGYQAAYSQLNFAQPKDTDPFHSIPDGRRFLMESLQKLRASNPGQIQQLIAGMATLHKEVLVKYCGQYGIQLA